MRHEFSGRNIARKDPIMRSNRIIASVAAALALGCLLTPTAANATAYCGIYWGSTDKAGTGLPLPGAGPLMNVRAGQHDCYDRLVIDSTGPGAAYRVRYVTGVPDQAQGEIVALRGGAYLEVVVRTSPYDLATGAATYTPTDPAELVPVNGWRTLRQVAWGGSFEGYTTIGVGVRARLPFRVFTLPGSGVGSRLVIDIAHQW
jgi:hypothetical protein